MTVNGKVQAVLLDPETFQQFEAQQERERFLAALREGIKDLEEGNVRPAEEVFEEIRAKYGF